MTALRIFRTARPSMLFAPVLPMDAADAAFWAERARRKVQEERKK